MNDQRLKKTFLSHIRKHATKPVFLHIRTRLRLLPFEKVIKHIPNDGPVLDIGCAYGGLLGLLYFAGNRNPLIGTDIDETRLRIAQQINPAPEQIRYIQDIAGEIPAESLRAIILCDVLYLLEDKEKERLLSSLTPYLAKDGVFFIKTTDPRKKIKFFWTYWQEILAVKILGWTKTKHTRLAFIKDLDSFCRFLASLGFRTEQQMIDRGCWYPHILITARKQ